jgi:DcuC family C4-dicarboxylate transporter
MSIPGIRLLLPMQLASSMGRAASPISGVIIATSGIAGVNPLDVARRNALPMAIALALMVITESFSLL